MNLLPNVRRLLGLGILTLIVAGPLLYLTFRQTIRRHFRVVHDGRLYRSGAMNFAEFRRFVEEYGIKTVINLRDVSGPNDPYPDPEEEEFCRDRGIGFLRLAALPWRRQADGSIPAAHNIEKILDRCDRPESWPVWIHCFSGEHRTGIACCVLRMEYDGWPNRRAVEEMVRLGYRLYDRDTEVREYLEGYVRRERKPSSATGN